MKHKPVTPETDDARECPYCTYPVDELSDGRLICVTCGVTWADADEMKRERETLAAAPFYGN